MKTINVLCLLFVMIYTPLVAIKEARDYVIYSKPSIESKIYTIWHIETFEGGSKARINYLNTISRQLEKLHDGILFYIKSIKPEELTTELQVNTPDIISYGYGVGDLIIGKAKPFDKTYGVRDTLLDSGTWNGKLYALPYIASGYAIISHNEDSNNMIAGLGYTNAKLAATVEERNISEYESQYEAYKHFVYDKTSTLIGTGRDVYRVTNLNSLGRLTASITPLNSFTDLIQYMSVFNLDEIITEYVESAVSSKMQSTLSSYHLYPVGYNKIYSTGIYSTMEDAIFISKTPRVFHG